MFCLPPISFSMLMTASLAPPWLGPHSEAMPAAMQANGLAPDEPARRHRRGRGVLLVVGVQHQDAVDRLLEHRVDLVLLGRHREHHAQEVGGVGEVVARIDERLADRILVGHARRWSASWRPGGTRRPCAGAGHGCRASRGRRPPSGADHAAAHRHRMGVAPEAAIKLAELLVHHGVERDVADELLLLRLGRQLALHQQVADLHEVALLGQLGDVVAAVEQDALVAVDVGDLGAARAGRGEARIVGEHVRSPYILRMSTRRGPDRAVDDGKFVGFAGFVIGQRARSTWPLSDTLSARFHGVQGHPNKPPSGGAIVRAGRYFAGRSSLRCGRR